MQDATLIPDDLASCQEKLRDALSLQAQLEEACLTMHAQQEQLQREVEELELTVKRLLNQLYGRRSERLPESAGQQHLNFGEEETSDSSLLSALDEADADFVEQIIERRRKKKKQRPRSEQLPDHLTRHTERIEPSLPPDAPFSLEDCELLGVDVVETLEYERGRLWVRRLEYPKYKVPDFVEAPANHTPTSEARAEETRVGETAIDGSCGTSDSVASETLADESCASEQPPVVPSEVETPTVASEQRASEPVACEAIVPASAGAETVHGASDAAELRNASVVDSALPPTLESPPPIVEPHGILQAQRVANVIAGGRFGFDLVTEVLYNKYVLHVPLYRQ